MRRTDQPRECRPRNVWEGQGETTFAGESPHGGGLSAAPDLTPAASHRASPICHRILCGTILAVTWSAGLSQTAEAQPTINVQHTLIPYCERVYGCHGPDVNPRHHFFLVLSWPAVPGAYRYDYWSDPGDWGYSYVYAPQTSAIVFSVDATDHNYGFDWDTGECWNNPLFLPFLLGGLEEWYAVPDTFHVIARIYGQDPVELGSVDGRPPARPVFLVPGMSPFDCSSTYANSQLQELVDGLIAEGFELDTNLFVVDTFVPSETQRQKAIRLHDFIAEKAPSLGSGPITLVGYSEGGRVARAYLNLFGNDPAIEDVNLVSVASPHKGSLLADLAFAAGGPDGVFLATSTICSISFGQLLELTTPVSLWNNRWRKLPRNTMTISGSADTAVLPGSSQIRGAYNVMVDGATHRNILSNPETHRQIASLGGLPYYGPDDVLPDWEAAEAACSEESAIQSLALVGDAGEPGEFNSQLIPGLETVIPEVGHLSPGDLVTFTLPIDVCNSVDFHFATFGTCLPITLQDADGEEAYNNSCATQDTLHLDAPAFGLWQVTVLNPPSSLVDGVFLCSAHIASALTVTASTDKSEYLIGSSGVLTVSVPAEMVNLGSVQVEVRFFRMDESVTEATSLTMNDGGIPPDEVANNGVWTGCFEIGDELGVYSLMTHVSGKTNDGHLFTRAISAYVFALQFAPADFDSDGYVDAEDFAVFEACTSGPAIPYDANNLPPGCTLAPNAQRIIPADLDADGDVDQSDFGIFQRCISGENVPADPNCAN